MQEPERRSRSYYQRRARIYDWSNRIAAFLRGASPTRERRKAVRRLRLKPGDRVLEVSVGTGTNLPVMATATSGDVRMVGLDISRAMLDVCRAKSIKLGITAALVEGEAAHLPFVDGSFDAVLHHGGLAEFGDEATAIAEIFASFAPAAGSSSAMSASRKTAVHRSLTASYSGSSPNTTRPGSRRPPAVVLSRLLVHDRVHQGVTGRSDRPMSPHGLLLRINL
jgi:SAM-dependent methyltransferase